ncbi:MAG: penicillin-binding protein 2 [Candidatus Cloacimonadales bacterium]|nr:penicillin-binding protein 2 [Candidatus Cloacimonadales bacterium]
MSDSNPLKIITYLISGFFLILLAALFKLQILEGKKYDQIAENNIVRIKVTFPIRGEIYDHKFRPIATNKPSFNLYITPGRIRNKETVINFVSGDFNMDREEIRKVIHENRFRLHQDILLIQNIPYEKMIRTSEFLNYYPSLDFKTEAIREYAFPNHFTGHLGRINEKEYLEKKDLGYTINSYLGKNGLEQSYETILRGKNGYNVIQVDASGKYLQFFKHNLDKPAQNGADLILSIDNDLQNYVVDILPPKERSAVVVMDTETGEILAYVSKPDFDLNIFSSNISQEDWNKISNDESKPMLDRVIHGTYPPGSVYKPILATLGLESGTILPETKLADCTGGLLIGDRFFKCWWEKGHGRLNVTEAIKVSCDVFFYDLSTKLSLAQMGDFTKLNMLTVKTGIDLPGERSGFFPTREWYVETYGKYTSIIGQKVNLAIGQGEILTTPLQICAYFAALANDGVWKRPHLLKKSISKNANQPYEIYEQKLPVSDENMKLIQHALWKAVNERYGTGTAASVGGVDVCGKTGSAENHMGDETHSWFAGYAIGRNYKISLVVFLENAGHGGSISAPLAGKIIQFYNGLEK